MAKKVPTRAVPTLSPQARNFVLQGQPEPPPPAPAAPPTLEVVPSPPPATLAKAPDAAPAKAARASATTALPARRPRSLVSRVDGRTLRRLQLYFNVDVARELKHHCVEHDIDMSAFVNELVARALRG